MFKRVFKFLVLISVANLFVGLVCAQESRQLTRSTNSNLFRTTPTEQIRFEEQTLIEQALQDKFDYEFNYQDIQDPEYKWASEMKQRGIFDEEDVRGISKNRAANRARRTIEQAIKGSNLDRGYKKLVRNLRKFRDYTTVKIEQNEKGSIRAKHKRNKGAKSDPLVEFYLQPDFSNGISAVAKTKNNIRLRYQPTRERLTVGYQFTF